jgi:hypothetical protein
MRPIAAADRADLRELVHILAGLLDVRPVPTSKRCPKCRRRLALTEFHLDCSARDGRYYCCKRCVKQARLRRLRQAKAA